VWLSRSSNAKRKLPYSWELVEVDFGGGPELVGVNTAHPNTLVAEALTAGIVPELAGYTGIRREVGYGDGAFGSASRIDFLLESLGRPPCYLEIKNVHLMRRQGVAEFPDSVTARGARHLDELAAMATSGARAVMLYVVQIGSAETFSLARDIDPAYGRAFDRARTAGVEALAWRCRLTPQGIDLMQPIPVTG
jgi:sugar fermentation stimulation protein A